jgi:AbiTii
MSFLLDDIINLAIDGKQPLPDILRKCLLLGHELKNERLKKWANQELNGYDSAKDLPDYRLVLAGAKGHFMGPFGQQLNHYPLPSALLEDIHRDFARKIHLTQGVSAYEGMIHSPESTMLTYPWPTDMVLYYQQKFLPDYALVSAWQDVPKSRIVELLDTVRNRTLNMALEIKDELGTSYTDLRHIKSEQAATNIQNIIFQNTGGSTNVAFGGSSIDASTNTEIIINVGDKQKLDEILSKAGLSNTDVQSLTEAIKADGENRPGSKVGAWVKDNASKVVTGGVKIGAKIGAELLSAWLKQYYGL